MKAVLALVFLAAVIALSSAEYDNGNGEPKCITVNLNKKIRNNWDPTLYWFCDEVGSAAKSLPCPDQTGFSLPDNDCVKWADWKWAPYENPPSA